MRKGAGFSLLEVLIAMALLAVGAVIGLTVVANTSARNELTREQAIAYKACQDVLEALMSMDKATLLSQKAWQATNGPSSFTVVKLDPSNPPSGSYTLTDLTSTILSGAPADSLLEIKVRFSWKNVNVMLSSRRYLP
jgi:prepilin-type N-terminal cleavage/methylation domain-containing protein